MAKSQTIVLTGNEALNRKLAALAGPKAKAVIRKAAREALRPVFAAVKSATPTRSGRLKRSVRLRAIARSRSRVGARITTGGSDNLFAGRTYYGGFQEYGWKAGKRATNASVGASKFKKKTSSQKAAADAQNESRKQIPGKKWMKTAADNKQSLALSIYELEVEKGLLGVGKDTV
jgi:hypothetical protein